MNQIILFTGLLAIACFGRNISKTTDNEYLENSTLQRVNIDTVQIVNDINNRVTIINKKVPTYKKVEKSLFGQSAEAGNIVAYYSENELKKVKVTHYGEMGMVTFGYYLDKGKIFFICKEQSDYDKPMYFNDFKIKSFNKNKHYFFNGKYLLSMNDNGQLINLSSDKIRANTDQLLREFNKIMKVLENL